MNAQINTEKTHTGEVDERDFEIARLKNTVRLQKDRILGFRDEYKRLVKLNADAIKAVEISSEKRITTIRKNAEKKAKKAESSQRDFDEYKHRFLEAHRLIIQLVIESGG